MGMNIVWPTSCLKQFTLNKLVEGRGSKGTEKLLMVTEKIQE